MAKLYIVGVWMNLYMQESGEDISHSGHFGWLYDSHV